MYFNFIVQKLPFCTCVFCSLTAKCKYRIKIKQYTGQYCSIFKKYENGKLTCLKMSTAPEPTGQFTS